jgi:hypothetical protein
MNLRNLLVLFGLALIIPAAGNAQSVRTWVSANGVDNSQCSRSSPCRTFSAAISAVNADGEVVVLDSAGYGPVTIDKAVTIVAPPGVHAAIAPTAGNAVTINSGISGAVILRGLYLNGQGATEGISHLGSNTVFVESCVINGFVGRGIVFGSTTTPSFAIAGTAIRGNLHGIRWLGSSPGGGVIEHSRLEGNSGDGLLIQGTGTFSVIHTVAANNGGRGFMLFNDAALDITNSAAVNNGSQGFGAAGVSSAGATMHLERCLASANNIGVRSEAPGGPATVRVSNCTIANNATGVQAASGSTIQSRGNNTLESNGSGNTFAATYTAK